MSCAGRREGFALVAVLWALVLLGALSVEFHAAARRDRGVALNHGTAARARWIARGGAARSLDALQRTLALDSASFLLMAARDTVLPPLAFTHEGMAVHAALRDARARLNLNHADQRALEQLARAAGLPAADASRFAAAVAAARVRRGERPFAAVAELRDVPGVSDVAFGRLAPFLTVIGDGRVNVNGAPVPVLVTLPGIDPGLASWLVEQRAAAPFTSVLAVTAALPAGSRAAVQAQLAQLTERMAFVPRDVELRVAADPVAGGPGAYLEGVVRLEGGARLTLLWLVER